MITNYIIKNNKNTIKKLEYYSDYLNMKGGEILENKKSLIVTPDIASNKELNFQNKNDSLIKKIKNINSNNVFELDSIKENLKIIKSKMEELNEELKKSDKDFIIDTNKLKEIDENLKPLMEKISEYDSNVYKLEKIKIDDFDFNYINIKQNFNAILNIYKNIVRSFKNFKLESTNEYEQINNKINSSASELSEELKILNEQINVLTNKIESDSSNIKNLYFNNYSIDINKYISTISEIEKENLNESEIYNRKDLLTIMIPDRIKEIEDITKYFIKINQINTGQKELYNAKFDINKYYQSGGKLLNKNLYNLNFELENLQLKMGKLNYQINYYEQLKIRYFYYLIYLGLLINKPDYLIYKTNFLEFKTIIFYKDLVNYIMNNLRENELKYFGKYHLITLLKIDNYLNFLKNNLKEDQIIDLRNIDENNLKIDSYLFSSFRKILDEYIIFKKFKIINRYILHKNYNNKNVVIISDDWIKTKDYLKYLNFNKARIFLQSGKILPIMIQNEYLLDNEMYNFDFKKEKSNITKINQINEYIFSNNFQDYEKYKLIDSINSNINQLEKNIIYIDINNEKNKFLFVITPKKKDILEDYKSQIDSIEMTSERKLKMKLKTMGVYFNPLIFGLTNSDLFIREFNKLDLNVKRTILNLKININNKDLTFAEEYIKNNQIKNILSGSITNIELSGDNLKYENIICVKLLYRILKLNNLNFIERFIKLVIQNLDRYEKKYENIKSNYENY